LHFYLRRIFVHVHVPTETIFVDVGKLYTISCIYDTDTWLGDETLSQNDVIDYPYLLQSFIIIISATVPVIGLYVLNTKLQLPEMYIGTAFAALGIFEKIGLAYSVHRWQFYAMKTVGYTVYISQSLVRSQLSKSLPSEDICKYNLLLWYLFNKGSP